MERPGRAGVGAPGKGGGVKNKRLASDAGIGGMVMAMAMTMAIAMTVLMMMILTITTTYLLLPCVPM